MKAAAHCSTVDANYFLTVLWVNWWCLESLKCRLLKGKATHLLGAWCIVSSCKRDIWRPHFWYCGESKVIQRRIANKGCPNSRVIISSVPSTTTLCYAFPDFQLSPRKLTPLMKAASVFHTPLYLVRVLQTLVPHSGWALSGTGSLLPFCKDLEENCFLAANVLMRWCSHLCVH